MAIDTDPHVLIIAGTDSSGGAGLSRDIETVAAFGLRSCVAVSAITVQTHQHFEARFDLPNGAIVQQMRAALTANNVKAIKIGMLARKQIIAEVCEVLNQFPNIPVILDPVLVSTSGGILLDEDAQDLLLKDLLPLCTLITPNVPELALLTNSKNAETQVMIVKQAARLKATNNLSILVKGGHSYGSVCIDTLFQPECSPVIYTSPRFDTSMRGSGCMISSAIAAEVAQGTEIDGAIRSAKRFILEQFKRRLAEECPPLNNKLITRD